MSTSENFIEWANAPRSVSQVLEFELCPHKSFLKRVRKTTPRPAAWTTQGIAFHTAAEQFEKSGRILTEDQTVEVYQTEYSVRINLDLEQWDDLDQWVHNHLDGPAYDIEERYVRGCRQTRNYVAYALGAQPRLWQVDGEPAVELEFNTALGDVPVRGFIDQVIVDTDGTLIVRDLKTGISRSKFQIWVYGLALMQCYPGVEVSAGDWYLAKENRVTRPVSMYDANADEIHARVAAMDHGVKSGVFPPTPGQHCRFCEVSHECDFFTAWS